jgi:hypothetical protein
MKRSSFEDSGNWLRSNDEKKNEPSTLSKRDSANWLNLEMVFVWDDFLRPQIPKGWHLRKQFLI